MKNALPSDSTDNEEKKVLINLIILASCCFQSVGQSLGVSIAINEKSTFSFQILNDDEKNLLMDFWVKTEINFR